MTLCVLLIVQMTNEVKANQDFTNYKLHRYKKFTKSRNNYHVLVMDNSEIKDNNKKL